MGFMDLPNLDDTQLSVAVAGTKTATALNATYVSTATKFRQMYEYGTYTPAALRVTLALASGAPTYLPANAKFGGAGFAAGLVSSPNIDTMLNAGGANTTFETWFKSVDASLRVIFGHPGWYWMGIDAGTVKLNYRQSDGVARDLVGGSGITTGVWHHLALVFNATKVPTIYLDGVSVAVGPLAIDVIPAGNTDPFIIGGLAIGASAYDWNGSIDEFRVSNVARYTAAFTAPAAEFTRDVNTVFLSHFNDASGANYSGTTGYEWRPTLAAVRAEYVGPVWPPEMLVNDTWIEVPA